MGRRLVLVLAAAFVPACTLLESRDGLVGSSDPLAAVPTGGADGSVTTRDDGGGNDRLSPPGDGNGTGDAEDAATTIARDANAAADSSTTATVDASDAATGPVVLYTGLLAPTGIALHGTDVCWVGGPQPRGLLCARNSGGGAVRNLDVDSDNSFLDDAFDIALDDTYIYWSNGKNNQVVKRAIAGGLPAQYFSGGSRLAYIVMRGTTIFATDFLDSPTAAAGNIVYGPIGTSSMVIYPGVTHAAGIGVLNATVFWGRSNPDALVFGPDTGNAVITTVPSPGGAVTGVAVDANKVAYFIAGNQRIYRLPRNSTTPEKIYEAPSAFGVSDVAVDDTYIYWSEHDTGRLLRRLK